MQFLLNAFHNKTAKVAVLKKNVICTRVPFLILGSFVLATVANGFVMGAVAHYIIVSKSSIEVILAYHPALSTEWLPGWKFPLYYDLCTQPHSFTHQLPKGSRA